MYSSCIETPEQLVQRQVDAYNLRDLEGFLATYDDDIELFHFPEQNFLRGLDAMRERYRKRFLSPGLHAQILARMTIGNRVIDDEQVTGSEDVANRAIAIYEIEKGKIRRVYFIVHQAN